MENEEIDIQAIATKLKRDNNNLYEDRTDTLPSLISTRIADLNSSARNKIDNEIDNKMAELRSILEDRKNRVESVFETYSAKKDSMGWFSWRLGGEKSEAERERQNQINEIVTHHKEEKERIIRETVNSIQELNEEYKRQKEEIFEDNKNTAKSAAVAAVGTAAVAGVAAHLARRYMNEQSARRQQEEEEAGRKRRSDQYERSKREQYEEEHRKYQQRKAQREEEARQEKIKKEAKLPNCSDDFYLDKCLELGLKEEDQVDTTFINDHFKCKSNGVVKVAGMQELKKCYSNKTNAYINNPATLKKISDFKGKNVKTIKKILPNVNLNSDRDVTNGLLNISARYINTILNEPKRRNSSQPLYA